MERYRDDYDHYEYEDDYRPRRRQQPSNAPWLFVGLLSMIIILGALLLHFRPDLLPGLPPIASDARGKPVPTTRTFPTLDAAALDRARQLAAQTSSEQQSLDNARPTDNASAPPLDPTAAADVAARQGGVATTVPATSFSPTDLGYRPAPTPTTMLSPEQFEASQASEEQNFLNTSASGLTPAQQLVQTHNAEQNAQGRP